MDGCTAIILCKTCQNWFCPSWHCLCCMMSLAGAFTTKQQCIHTDLCTMTKLGWRQFWHNYALQIWLLSSHPWPNMLSSTDNLMICLFDFERFTCSIKSWFPFFLYSHCTVKPSNSGHSRETEKVAVIDRWPLCTWSLIQL